MPTSIEVRDLTKAFAGGTPAVDRVSLAVAPGELFFLLGPSGCGKSTLLRMIAGFTEPTGGQILFDGQSVANLPANQRDTGMVFQSYALWPHMNVSDNVGFGLDVRRVSKGERVKRIDEALASVHMEAYASRKPNQLSGGQQQRVALARAMVIRPKVLLLDEPLSNLDAKLRLELRSEIRRLCKQAGMTAIYVTHDQKEALSMADRIAVLQAGRIAQIGTPREVYDTPSSPFVAEFIGETNLVPARVERADPSGCTLAIAGGTLRSSATPPPGARRVVVSMRPEALRLAIAEPPPQTRESLRGRVSDAVYLGDATQYTVAMDATISLRVTQQAGFDGQDIRSADEVDVSVDPRCVLVFPVG